MTTSNDFIAKAETNINAPIAKVWDALVNPDTIKQYMFGTTVTSEWKTGSRITWAGEWKGKTYEDKGEIISIVPQKELKYSHYSPLAGKPDLPQNYHTVTIHLSDGDGKTIITLQQDNNATEEEKQHSEKNWMMMLEGLKKVVEKGA